jgi:hypothetical protein
MRITFVVMLMVLLGGNSTPAASPDLSHIERTIAREPVFQYKQPRYCLLLFGAEAQSRLWLISDGNTIYFDRNGDGDLTQADEKIPGKPALRNQNEITFDCGYITTTNGVPDKTRIEVLSSPGLTFVQAYSEGRPWQRAVVDKQGYLEFGATRQSAPILHFNGPLTIGTRFDPRFKRKAKAEELDFDVMVGTPGVGAGSFVRFGNEAVDPAIHPELEVLFPGLSAPTRIILDKRC